MANLQERIQKIQAEIIVAAKKSGRKSSDVTLIAVSKTYDLIQQRFNAGDASDLDVQSVSTQVQTAKVNIANMTVSRNREGGKALMALSVDTPAAPDVIEHLQQGADDVYLVSF